MERAGGIIRKKYNNIYKYLVVQNRTTKIWSFPKGHLEKSDKTYLHGALREIKEETGLDLKDVKPIGKTMMNLNIYFIYDLCDFQKQETKGIDTDVKISKVIDTQEIGDIKWFSLSEMKSERCNYDVKMFIKQQKFL